MNTLVILSLLLVTLYLGVAIWRKRELPETVSDMVWWLRKDRQWIWSAWLVAVGLLLFAPLTERCGWMGWLTEVCLLGSALTPLMNHDTRVWHKWLGIDTGVLSQICVVMLCPDWLFAWAIFAFIMGSVYVQPEGRMAKAVMHKGVFVAEVVCTVSLIGSMIFGYQGKQNAAGDGSSFGQGANQGTTNYRYCSGAGGGGWYGGGGQRSDSSMTYCKYSGEGSGWVNTAASAGNRPSGYTGLQLDSGTTTAGSSSFPAPSGGTETGHEGDGYTRITRIS